MFTVRCGRAEPRLLMPSAGAQSRNGTVPVTAVVALCSCGNAVTIRLTRECCRSLEPSLLSRPRKGLWEIRIFRID